ncbi:uncharacterized protein LOC127733724 [Mytilus californianus]|uniref:uncharacterized protein LOC127733724 n=1 Tax=Mytilus californianus TaxID=6549 RepID=UPI002246DC3D|nr:uncharacterized protein LOC127733724 [Mytilus californianus]
MTFDIDIRHIGNTFCKIHTWILYFSLDFSAWIQVAVTVERLCAVWYPVSGKYKCSRHTAVRAIHRHISPLTTPSSVTQSSKLASMSITLFTLNSVFLVCNIPISIYLIQYEHLRDTLKGRDSAFFNMMWAIVNILMYSNNAISFVLYILSGTKFRKEFTAMLCCRESQ